MTAPFFNPKNKNKNNMKNLKIEGFKIVTNLDEQDVFRKSCNLEGINPDSDECLDNLTMALFGSDIMDFIEQVGIDGQSVANYFYNNCKGYRDRRLEPFNWRSSKKKLTLSYTGAKGGESWYADIYIC